MSAYRAPDGEPTTGLRLVGQDAMRWRASLDSLVSSLGGLAFACSTGGGRVLSHIDAACAALLGLSAQAITEGQVTLASLVHPHDRASVARQVARVVAAGQAYVLEYRILGADGAERWLEEHGLVVDAVRIEGVLLDVTERVLLRTQLAEAELRYRSVFDNSLVGIYQTTTDGHYIAANATLARLYGYESPAQLIETLSDIANCLYVDPNRRADFKMMMATQGFVSGFESEVYRRDGSRIWITEHGRAIPGPDGNILYYTGTVEDISERRRYREQLEFQANRDALTGLPNRNLIKDRLEQAMAYARRNGDMVAVAFVDLDNFKVINDSLGHAAGDELIQAMAHRLSRCVRQADTVARYGGDEFVILLGGLRTLDEVSGALERVQAAVRKPLLLSGHDLQVSCSIGVSMFPADGCEMDTLLQHADVAMYHAKAEGKGQHQFYTSQLNAAVRERLAMESALRRALELGELSVAFQPKLDARAAVSGFEALVRWHSPELGWVEPSRFVPLAEETGLIVPLTEFVLRRACEQAASWPVRPDYACCVAVNLSVAQLRDASLVATIRQVLADTGLAPARLELEITESWLACNQTRTARILEDIKALGCSIAVDDFGTGYSSLAYLKRFPVDVLKIDRSFVSGIALDEDSRAIPRAIVSMGHSLGMRVVAEGVETFGQFEFLASLGCQEFQGFYFSRPLPGEAVTEYLQGMLSAPQVSNERLQ